MLLAIDTAGPACSAGFFEGDHALASASEEIGRGHAERLMPMIEELRGQADVALDNISQIAVTVGPGSFTGLRVGLAAARGFALALGCPCTGVSVLEAFNHAFGDDKPIGIAIDARREQVWWQAFGTGDESEPTARKATPHPKDPIRLAGSGAHLLAGSKSQIISRAASAPIAAVAAVALTHLNRPPNALYLRAPDAKPQAIPAGAAP